jgi:hypothetical protein
MRTLGSLNPGDYVIGLNVDGVQPLRILNIRPKLAGFSLTLEDGTGVHIPHDTDVAELSTFGIPGNQPYAVFADAAAQDAWSNKDRDFGLLDRLKRSREVGPLPTVWALSTGNNWRLYSAKIESDLNGNSFLRDSGDAVCAELDTDLDSIPSDRCAANKEIVAFRLDDKNKYSADFYNEYCDEAGIHPLYIAAHPYELVELLRELAEKLTKHFLGNIRSNIATSQALQELTKLSKVGEPYTDK